MRNPFSQAAEGSRKRVPDLLHDAIPVALFLVLTCVMTNPLVLHLANAVEDKQDGLLNTWIIGWVGHALITDPLNLFNANIFYPYPNTLAFSETMLPQGLFGLPFNLAFDNTVLGYNLVLLASFFLAAYAMYLFVFDLTRNRNAAIVSGIIFSFNPYNLGNLAQVQLLSFGWLPLAMMYLWRMLNQSPVASRQSPVINFRLAFLFALFFSLQALSSFYYAFLAAFAVALYILWFFITHHPSTEFTLSNVEVLRTDSSRITPSTSLRTRFYVSRFKHLVIAAILVAIAVIPFFLPYLQVQRDMGFERKLAESESFSASLKLYTQVSPQNILYGNLLAPRPPIMLGSYPLDNLFPGVFALVLAIIGIVAAKNRNPWFYLLLLAFAFLLSLGPRLFLTPSIGTDITLPYRWLYDTFPLMKALRAPVRFDALVMFALAILAGFGIARLTHQVSRVAPLLIIIEYFAFPAASITPVPVGVQVPQSVRWLAKQTSSVVLELPMMSEDPTKRMQDLTTQYLSTYHWQSSPDGYSGFNPPKRGEIAYEMESFPSERSISLLQALDVRFVVVHSDRMPNWKEQQTNLGRLIGIQLEQQFGNDLIYRIVPLPQLITLKPQLYLPNPASPSQSYLAFLILRNRGALSYAVKPTNTLRMFANWSDGTREQVNATMPLVTTYLSIVPIRLNAPSKLGNYQLELQVFPKGIDPWVLTGEVSVEEGDPAHQIVLPAIVTSQSIFKTYYSAGEDVLVDLTWLPLNKIDGYYSASVRLIDAKGNKIAAAPDREPKTSTLLWKPGEPVQDRFTITLPPTIAYGDYTIQVLMYQGNDGTEALLLDENFVPQETIALGMITVK
ncbi:MAG: hypothetical protein HZB51_20020 [Chloroflexi bacterium]|nr:hypothetical protein [Chloroflexota bacterium]